MPKIPALEELKSRPQWVAWKLEDVNGRPTKVPYRPDGQGKASSTDSQTWGTVDEAWKLARSMGGAVGFVVTRDDPYLGVDLDACYDPSTGEVDPQVRGIVDALDSYTEISPSGHGLRVWIKAKKHGDHCRTGKIEVYDADRYFTVSGRHLSGTPDVINARQEQFDNLYESLWPAKPVEPAPNGHTPHLPDVEVILLATSAKNGAATSELLAGNWESLYESQSEADYALVSRLSFFTQDPEQIDRIFRGSGLYRDKWDRLGRATIDRVLATVKETYTPAPPPVKIGTLQPPATESAWRLKTTDASVVYEMDIPEPQWVVEPIMSEGLTLLAGAPKIGKSWLMLDLAIQVVTGGTVLESYEANQGSVLYLALEDGNRRMRSRMRRLGLKPPPGLLFAYDWERGQKGINDIEEWIQDTPDAKLFIVDTLKHFRTPSKGRNVYDEDVDAISPIQKLAVKHGIGAIVVHHTRKAAADDVLGEVNGTHGITGTVDSIWILKRKRLDPIGSLEIIGRETMEQHIPLQFQDVRWKAGSIVDPAIKAAMQYERAKSIAASYSSVTFTAPEMAEQLHVSENVVRQLIGRMSEEGLVKAMTRGRYKWITHEEVDLYDEDMYNEEDDEDS